MRTGITALTLFICITAKLCSAQAAADTTLLRKHLLALVSGKEYRTYTNTEKLNQTADYIRSVLAKYTDSVGFQEYSVNGKTYKNVIASFGPRIAKRIVIGAHYDVCGPQQGADDNASGVAGLLELARLLKGQRLNYRVDLVAYTLEEPPFFRTENMGSYIHAKSLSDSHAKVYGMISLEMIGYFSDEKNSQSYPIGLLSLVYGNKGNYITLVKKWASGSFAREFCKKYKHTKALRTKRFSGPPSLPGLDFSDHLNYWKFGFSALMITDTSFYRNKNYHQPTDTIEMLDFKRMAKVVDGVLFTLLKL